MEGIKEGKEEGIKEGREIEKKEFVITMLKNNFTFDQIQLCTSFSQAQIEQIAKDNNLL